MRRNARKIPLTVRALHHCDVRNIGLLKTVAPTPKMRDHCFMVCKFRISIERFLRHSPIPMKTLSQLIEKITVGVGHSSEYANPELNSLGLEIV